MPLWPDLCSLTFTLPSFGSSPFAGLSDTIQPAQCWCNLVGSPAVFLASLLVSSLFLPPQTQVYNGERLALVSALSFHRFVLLRMPALAVWEGERDNVLLCLRQNRNEGRKEGCVQILPSVFRSSVTLSISSIVQSMQSSLIVVNSGGKSPGRAHRLAPPQAYSRLPPAVSAAAPLSACSRCSQHSTPAPWD